MKDAGPLDPPDAHGPTSSVAASTLEPGGLLRTFVDAEHEPAQVIEEYVGADLLPTTSRDPWLLLAIVSGIAVIVFGFAGRLWTPPSAGNAAAEPSATAVAGVVAVPIPTLLVAVTVPARDVTAAPEAGVASVLEVTSTTMASSISVSLRRSATYEQSGDDAQLVIVGHAPADVRSVTIDIRTVSGSLLASAVVQSVVDDERPGSNGGPRVGVGRLYRPMVVPALIPANGWQVEITWRDRSNSPSGSATQRIASIGL